MALAFNFPSISDVAERAVSTGWQVAAGGAIATGIFHDVTLTPVCAAGFSVLKTLAVWFYTKQQTPISNAVKDVESVANQVAVAVPAVAPVVAAAEQAAAPVIGS